MRDSLTLSGCPRHVGRNYVPLLFGVDTIECRITLLRNVIVIADCYASEARETQVCKSTTLLHESRRGSDHTQNTSIWSDQRLTPIM